MNYRYKIPDTLLPDPKPNRDILGNCERELMDAFGDVLTDFIRYELPLLRDIMEKVMLNFDDSKFPTGTLDLLQNYYKHMMNIQCVETMIASSWSSRLITLGLLPGLQDFTQLVVEFKSRHNSTK